MELRKPPERLQAESEERREAHKRRVLDLKKQLRDSLKSRKSLIELHDLVMLEQNLSEVNIHKFYIIFVSGSCKSKCEEQCIE